MRAASQPAKEFSRPFSLHLFLMITAEYHMANKDLNSLPDEGIYVLSEAAQDQGRVLGSLRHNVRIDDGYL